MAKVIAILSVCASLGLAACGGDDDGGGSASPTDGGGSQATAGEGSGTGGGQRNAEASGDRPERGIEIATAGSQYGDVLFDSEQRAIYIFDKESGPRSECYGACAEAWPPVLTEGEPQAGGAVEARLLGTITRDDGTTQVTYAGQPLYYYVDDPLGQVLCHNVEEFGGLWLAVEPSGEAVS